MPKNSKIFSAFEAFQWILPAVLIVVIQVFTLFPGVIEHFYSIGIYTKIGAFLRAITCFLPISLGDILYAVVTVAVIVKIIVGVFRWIKYKLPFSYGWKSFLWLVKKLTWLYIWFNILWGLNYYRLGISHQLNLKDEEYTTDELCDITDMLISKTNYYRNKISSDTVLPLYGTKKIFKKAAENYKSISKEYNFLKYNFASVKPSFYNSLAAYIGFTGYYNPFSGEAQLRTDIPEILLPYTASHEIAHQLGYASETEANFVGYLAASQSNDDYFKYSVYLDLYKYSRMQLFMHNRMPSGDVKLDSLVRYDLLSIRKFFLKEQNSIAPVSMSLYNAYLKANHQDKGMESYDDVISYLIRYYKKTGKL